MFCVNMTQVFHVSGLCVMTSNRPSHSSIYIGPIVLTETLSRTLTQPNMHPSVRQSATVLQHRKMSTTRDWM